MKKYYIEPELEVIALDSNAFLLGDASINTGGDQKNPEEWGDDKKDEIEVGSKGWTEWDD